MSREEKIEKIFSVIGRTNNKRLGRCFKTKKNNYYFDTGTGKVFSVEDDVYYVLKRILDNTDVNTMIDDSAISLRAVDEVLNTITTENILLAPQLENFIGPQISDLDERLNMQRKQVTLELTERCNLRCKYCLYNVEQGGYRQFGTRDMTFDIAKKAIDDLMRNSGDESVYVSFYGGEPLLKFDLLKECIDYCESLRDRDITYAITTNGTLITRDIADYFAALGNKIHITLSIDGPQSLNDKNRVYINGMGSFSDVMKGLQNLLDAFDDKEQLSLGINSVLAEPTRESFNMMEDFFGGLNDLPKNVVYTSSFVATKDESIPYPGVDSDTEREVIYGQQVSGYFDPLFEWATAKMDEIDLTEKKIARDNIVKELALIHKRLLFDKPMDQYYLNGCCVPGARRVYVTTQGDYLICEKLGPSPTIGNVNTGLDIDKIKKVFVKEFCDQAKLYCKDCWAVHLCGMCYMNSFDEDGVNLGYRHSKCMMNRIYMQKDLELYHEILENNPDALHIVDEYDFV